jgi:AraC family transcriptional regulator
MTDRPTPEFRFAEAIALSGSMAVYDSQADATVGIPQQWRTFLGQHSGLGDFYGASPCTNDHKIHYLTGVGPGGPQGVGGEVLTLEAGEYAVVRVEDATRLRDTWVWLLTEWLADSGRRERHAPEFERYSAITEAGTPNGATEIWIPLEPAEG